MNATLDLRTELIRQVNEFEMKFSGELAMV